MLWILVISIVILMASLSYKNFSKENGSEVSEFQQSTLGKIATALSITGCLCFGLMIFAIMDGNINIYIIMALFLGSLVGVTCIFLLRSKANK